VTNASDDRCVLVVDDEEDIRESLREVVEMAGCSAVTAANGSEGLEMIARHHPCLVIVDLAMPVMTGEEMIDAMRKEPSFANVAIVISTSAPSRAPRGVPVIPKPVDIRELWRVIRLACRCDPTAAS
jgi:two-component system response regulator CpxR